MSLKKELDEVYCAALDISQGINALELMSLGLAHARDPYAEGFNALYSYLFDANRALCKHLTACMETV